VHVEVVYALPEVQHRVHLELSEGATVGQALAAVSRVEPFASLDLERLKLGVFGRLVGRTEILRHGDRLEVYRPLAMDPKEARRRRADDSS
jgi:putative ubiquitin-RnfH superfamily antitoxin RatB of RatAB toxin-antitoxin module